MEEKREELKKIAKEIEKDINKAQSYERDIIDEIISLLAKTKFKEQ